MPTEYLNVLKWPIVILILAGIVLFYLLPQIRAVIPRLTKFKYKDAEASADQAAVSAQDVAVLPKTVANHGPHPFELSDHPHVRRESERIAGRVRGMVFASNEERDKWVYREGAQLSIALDFERIYRNVWASQMELLAAANRPGGTPIEEVKQRYAAAAHAAPQVYSTYPIERWLGFVQNFGLVQAEGTSVIATDKGALFIQYLVVMHYDLHGLRRDL